MAPLLDDPNNAILLDFRTDDHGAARAQLITNGVANNVQAAELLAALWTMNNNTAQDLWAEQIEEAARDAEEIQRLAAEDEREHQQAIMEEQEAACKEEQKKNLSLHHPFPLCRTVVRKLKAGEYCELYYFTNKGLKDAKKSILSTEAPGLMLTTTADSQQTWVNADETHNPKSCHYQRRESILGALQRSCSSHDYGHETA
ncbi:hypothetical protein DFH29DRAFT_872972 [Suillus ampliporus]|nr:hypothetical protein DFH29DRAFT_872972 [Suillus ampliporus]